VVQDRGVIALEKNKLLIPPNNTRYVTYGHKDLTIRVGLQESDKGLQVGIFCMFTKNVLKMRCSESYFDFQIPIVKILAILFIV